jgi:hypothetical protein
MATRTYRYFQCENGHDGTERTSLNDRPYSTLWESVAVVGMVTSGEDPQGRVTYRCGACNAPMVQTHIRGADGDR